MAEEAEGYALADEAALQVVLCLAPFRKQAAPVGQRSRLAVRVPALQGSTGRWDANSNCELNASMPAAMRSSGTAKQLLIA